ncbi:metal-dependent transcriptional regulator [Schaalia sp. 19OD2882]|uniref:metal-dependent transcriptional regulator n=1 Tax=Schaalia sp. 19OD2882 TaxID=2794089 RepID=UPI001C1EA136|nr:metal-dependent transcriptional regulator [Schaalia sp. 19OD2882]QWW20382.1 metal-dependent transcriptional regulator [Schaalia sp. 19OD2882]
MATATSPRTTSAVAQDYLKLLWAQEEVDGAGLSVNDLARATGVVASTASENVTRLAAQGLLSHKPYQKVHLTDQGRAVAIGMIRRHRLLETYLHDALGFNWDEIHEEAEILEHAVSDRLLDRLDEVLGHPARDPHGDPIPAPDGGNRGPVATPLVEVEEGASVRVVRVSDRDTDLIRALHEAGVRLDADLEVLRHASDGQMRVRVGPDGAEVLLPKQWCQAIHVLWPQE